MTDIAGKPRWRRIVDFPLVTMVIAAATFVFAQVLAQVIGGLLPKLASPWEELVSFLIALTLALLAYKFVIAKMGERPRDDLPWRGSLKGLGAGTAVGFVLFSAVVGVAALVGVYSIAGDGDRIGILASLILIGLVPGFFEEVLIRGILFRWLEEFGGSWFALVASSLLFGFAHFANPNATLFSSLAIAVEAGILLGGAYMLTRSLWFAIGIHAAWNFTQGEIFDVPVSGLDQQGLVTARLSGPEWLSGGAFGLEASVIAMLLATSLGIWFVVLAARRGHLVQPWWVRRRQMPQEVATGGTGETLPPVT
ncbi:CPBP family intramembrane metalloprotease [Sphingomonas swuensis]|uniref:CPBP family intramembrane metalloprotease n=1 Tax=Sphingomonas swuensis TaxID=977800 RepID=A0ABP7SQK0_9SPHN